MTADIERGFVEMIARDCARMRQAGGDLAEAAIRVIHDYDGLHRLSLAVARWAEAIAAEGDRPHAASVDTRPEGGDATQIAAPFTSGAVPERQTPQPHPKGQTRSNKSRPVT